MDNALSCEDGLALIENSLIDGASQSINGKAERFIELIDIKQYEQVWRIPYGTDTSG